jgi:hypothetical protein
MVIFGGFGAGKGVVWERGQPIASAAFHPKNDPCYGLTPFMMYAYEDIVNPPGLPPVLPTGSGAPDAGSGVQPGKGVNP